jgi:ribonuclease HII
VKKASALEQRPRGVKYLIGVDEVGRGPLAGPVAVGAFLVPVGFDFAHFQGVRDSKKLPPHRREAFVRLVEEKEKAGEVKYAVSFVSSEQIDKRGLSYAIKKALSTSLQKLKEKELFLEDECLVLLDGGLKAPAQFKYQKTIIKGDDKEKVISLASVVAKVTRDHRLMKLSKKYPQYQFHINKGYGTKQHREHLEHYGPCPIHRRSFLGNFALG